MLSNRPKRIRLSRAKGWRLPRGAVKVARPSPFGNPFRVDADGPAETCVARFRHLLRPIAPAYSHRCHGRAVMHELAAARRRILAGLDTLQGRDLACWCPLCPAHAEGKPLGETCRDCAPCHADVLLELANP